MAMSVGAVQEMMTVEEFLALPDDLGLDRELINGVLVEKPMTYRSRPHTRAQTRAGQRLANWLDTQRRPIGDVFSGEVGCRLPGRETIVGIDVAVFSEEILAAQPDPGVDVDPRVIEGAPLLAVEILSPSDTQEGIWEKVDEYLAAGVPLVWVLDPHFQTVAVHRPAGTRETFHAGDELSCPDVLPGFSVTVSKLFGR
jgi:Uma2 family endonuclease